MQNNDNTIRSERTAWYKANAPLHINDALLAIWRPGEVREIRIPRPKGRGGRDSGYFNNSRDAAQAAVAYADPGKPVAVAAYLTVNPVAECLLARSVNRITRYVNEATADDDILRRAFLPIDVDADAATGISATAEERALALAVTTDILDYLATVHGVQPTLAGTSGNGGFAWLPIDLPNDAAATALVKGVLSALADIFNEPGVIIDPVVCNPARLMKVPGTIAAKGDHMVGQGQPDRPWRPAWAFTINPDAPVTTAEQLRAIAAEVWG